MPPPAAEPAAARVLPDLRALQAFVTVCEAGSMAVAARRLGLSPSAVSQGIQALERACGSVLFDREVRPAQPTRAGRALLDDAQALLAQAYGVSQRLHGRARQEHAQVRLGCVDSFAATVGPTLVRALSGTVRQLQLWSGLTPTLAAQLQAREIDLAICTETALDDTRILQRPLFAEPWVLVLPRDALPGHRAPRSLAEFRGLAARMGEGLPLVRYSGRSMIGQQIERLMRHAGIDAPRRFEFDATDALLSLVAAGLGWAVSTPLCLWQSRAALDGVRVLPLPLTPLGRREFFLLSHADAWAGLDDELARLTRQVLRHDVMPALRAHLPALRGEPIVLDTTGAP